jgi:hypothetical protein
VPNYILRNVPEPLWSRVRERAAAEGWPLKALIVHLLEQYVEGTVTPRRPPFATTED